MIRGKAGHKGQEVNFKQKKITGFDEPESVITDATRDKFVEESKYIEDWEGQNKDVCQDDLIDLMKKIHKEHNPQIIPIAVEEKIEITIPILENENRVLLLYPDLLATNGLHDYKFTTKTKSQTEADTDLQLTMYSYATGEKRVQFDSAVITKARNKSIGATRSIRTENDWSKLEMRIPRIIKAIESGIFYPCDPSFWRCRPKKCGFWNICEQGAKNNKAVHFDIKNNPIF